MDNVQVSYTANSAPTISNLSGDSLSYTEGAGAVAIDQGANALVADVDSTNFDTGALTVSIPSGGDSAEDVLSIRNQGTGAGEIGVSGTNVTYQGVTIGTFTGGSSGSNLAITLNASATPTAVTALVKNITYQDTDTNAPTTGARTVRFVLTDGDGGTSANYDTTVAVSGVNDAPTITSNGGGATASFGAAEGQTAVTTVTATDVDAGQTLSFPIVGGADAAKFTINSSTGQLSFVTAPNYEAATDSGGNNIYDVTVQVSDSNGGTDTQAISVSVTRSTPGVTISSLEPTALGDEFRVNTTTSGDQWAYYWSVRTVALANDGSFVQVWIDTGGADGSQYGIYGQRYDANGNAAGGQFLVNTTTTLKQDDASIAMHSDGSFIVLWDGPGDGNGTGVFGQRFAADGSRIGGEFQVNTSTASNLQYPELDFAADGSFVATWVTQGGGPAHTLFQRFDASGNKVGGEVTLNTGSGSDEIMDSLEVKADGSFIVTWTEGGDVYGRLYDANTNPAGAAFRINQYTTNTQEYSVVRADANGNFTVVWESQGQDGSLNGVYMRRFAADGTALGNEVAVATHTAGDQYWPTMAMDQYGNYVVAWGDANGLDGSGNSVWMQRFDSSGNRVGASVQVNQTTAGSQDSPVMAMNDSGRLVVAWEGNGVGDTYGVFARRYDLNPNVTEGSTTQFQVVLNTAPTSVVTLNLSVSDSTEASLSTTSLVFNSTNWNIPQTVTISGLQDLLADGGQSIRIITSALSSSDANYNGLNPDNLVVLVQDSGVVNSAPVISSNGGGASASVTVAENSTVVTTVTATDANAGQTLIYSIAGGADAAKFTINSSTGQLSFIAAPNYDSPTDSGGNNVYDVTVQVSDSMGATDTQAISVTVTNVNETPTDLSLSGNTVAENAANGTVVGTITGTDPDSGDTKSYSFTDSAGGRFAVNSATGQITVANGSLLNYEAASSHSVTVRVTDSAGLTYDEAFTINLTNMNEAPTGADATVTINEDTSHTLTSANFGFSDVDAGDALSAVRIDTLPGSGTLALSGAAVTAGQVVTVADINAGNVVFTPAANANGTGYATLTFSVRDSNNGYDAAPNSLTFDVTAVNDAPTRTAGAVSNLIVLEDAGLASLGLGGVAYSPSGGADESGQTLSYAVTAIPSASIGNVFLADGTTRVTVGSYTLADIQGMQFKPTENASGVTAFQFNVYDSGGTTNGGADNISQFILITVNAVNDAPTITNLSGDSLSYSEGDGAVVIEQGANGLVADVDSTNLDTGTLTVSIPTGGDSAEDVLSIKNQGTGAGQIGVSGSNITYGGVTIGTFTGGSSGTNLVITFNASATPTAVTALVKNITFQDTDTNAPTAGARTVRYVLTDGDTSANYDTTVTVSGVNDAPVVDLNAGGAGHDVTTAFTEQTPVLIAPVGTLSDVDSATLSSLTVTLTARPDGNAVESLSLNAAATTATSGAGLTVSYMAGTGVLSITGAASTATYQTILQGILYIDTSDTPTTTNRSITVVANDGTVNSATATVTITVTAVDDLPVAVADTLTVAEDSGTTSGTLATNDTPSGDGGNVWALATGATNGVAVVNADGTYSYTPTANYTGPDSFTYTLTDADGDVSTATVTITVTAVDDLPTLTTNTGSTAAEGGSDIINSGELSVGDIDNVAAQLTFSVGTGPAFGRLELITSPGVPATSFTQADIIANRLVYVHDGSETTSDTFTFTVNDGAGGTVGSTTVTLTITPVNDAPTIISGGGGATASINVAENVSAVTIVTGADVDLPAQALTYSVSGGADQALFAINAATGALAFTAPRDFEVATDANGDNIYVVQVRVTDSQGASTTQTIQVTVTDVVEGAVPGPGSPTIPPVLLTPPPPSLSTGGPQPTSAVPGPQQPASSAPIGPVPTGVPGSPSETFISNPGGALIRRYSCQTSSVAPICR